MQALRQDNPDVIIFSAAWQAHFKDNEVLIRSALNDLLSVSPKILVLSNPPILPKDASREYIRSHGQKVFFELPEYSASRDAAKRLLIKYQAENIAFIDIDPICKNEDGSLKLFTPEGKFLYRDSTHVDTEAAREVTNQLLWPQIAEFFNYRNQ
jgi:hypothetical protein